MFQKIKENYDIDLCFFSTLLKYNTGVQHHSMCFYKNYSLNQKEVTLNKIA